MDCWHDSIWVDEQGRAWCGDENCRAYLTRDLVVDLFARVNDLCNRLREAKVNWKYGPENEGKEDYNVHG